MSPRIDTEVGQVRPDGAAQPQTHTDPPANNGAHGKRPARGPWTELLARSADELQGAAESLIEVYADRVKLSIRRKIMTWAIGACVAVVAVVWLSAAVLSTLRGMRGGLAEWSGGHEWFGDLAGGLLALAIAATAAAIHLYLSARRELARLKTKYERIREERDEDGLAASSAGDGGSPARP